MSVKKYSFTSPQGHKYTMSVSKDQKRVFTKNGERLAPSKIPSPARRGLMASVIRKRTFEDFDVITLATMAKNMSIFEIMKTFCSVSYALREKVCMNSHFWTQWINVQDDEQSIRYRLEDWFTVEKEKPLFTSQELVESITKSLVKNKIVYQKLWTLEDFSLEFLSHVFTTEVEYSHCKYYFQITDMDIYLEYCPVLYYIKYVPTNELLAKTNNEWPRDVLTADDLPRLIDWIKSGKYKGSKRECTKPMRGM